MRPLNKSKGITLVELMISMGLGVVICTATLQAFITSKQILMAQQALARLQENARIAYLLFGENIESSGSLGCNSFSGDVSFNIASNIDPNRYGLQHRSGIIAVKEAMLKQFSLSEKLKSRMKPESDILMIQRTRKKLGIVSKVANDEGLLEVIGHLKLKPEQIITLSDCSHIDFVKIQKVDLLENKKITKIWFKPKSLPMSKHYVNAEMGILSSKLLYVGKSGRVNENGHPVDALYCTDLNNRTLELIEGVEHLQISYGISSHNNFVFYSGDEISDWRLVSRVRVSILLNSIEDGLLKPKKYQVNDHEVMPHDRLMRKWWTFEWSLKSLS